MAIVFQAVNGTNSVATTATPAMPASIAAGDLLISECFLGINKLFTSINNGWTIIRQGRAGAGGPVTGAIAYKVAAGSADQPTWSWDGTSTRGASNVWRFTGAITTNPIGASAHAFGNGTAASVAAILATSANAYFASFLSVDTNQVVPVPSGYTSDNTFSSSNLVVASERGSHITKTNVGDSSGSTAVTITSANWFGFLLELRTQAPPAMPRTQIQLVY